MTTYLSDFAPDSLPAAEYTRVNQEQAAHIRAAMEKPERQAQFDITFLPLETAEQRQAAAQEWAAYLQAVGSVKTREVGAFAVMSSKDESPEGLIRLLEDKDPEPGSRFITHALLRVVKKSDDAEVFELLREYYL